MTMQGKPDIERIQPFNDGQGSDPLTARQALRR
jgi:hypothetical protein